MVCNLYEFLNLNFFRIIKHRELIQSSSSIHLKTLVKEPHSCPHKLSPSTRVQQLERLGPAQLQGLRQRLALTQPLHVRPGHCCPRDSKDSTFQGNHITLVSLEIRILIVGHDSLEEGLWDLESRHLQPVTTSRDH